MISRSSRESLGRAPAAHLLDCTLHPDRISLRMDWICFVVSSNSFCSSSSCASSANLLACCLTATSNPTALPVSTPAFLAARGSSFGPASSPACQPKPSWLISSRVVSQYFGETHQAWLHLLPSTARDANIPHRRKAWPCLVAAKVCGVPFGSLSTRPIMEMVPVETEDTCD